MTPPQINRRQVAIYDGRDGYVSAPLDCGNGAGPLNLPGAPQTLACKFSADGLRPNDGVFVAVVVPAGGSRPAAAGAVPYSVAGLAKATVGACAELGSSLVVKTPDGARAAWQPKFTGKALSGRTCRGGALRFAALLGGGGAPGGGGGGGGAGGGVAAVAGDPGLPACGTYSLQGGVIAAPQGGTPVTGDTQLDFEVTGC
jgi:hypothetical protein